MSGAQTVERVSMGDPFAMSFDAPGQGAGQMVAVPAGTATVGAATDRAMAEVFVAQRVAIKRNMGAILQEARSLAGAAGSKFYYSIPFKNSRKGTTEYVEGPTIGCAMAAVNIYGNCRVEAFPAQVTPTHWTFAARFVDYEKGVTIVRTFQQRRKQDTGMKDDARAEDIIFQIGQSKALRNVVIAALGWLVDEMETEAKSGLLKKVEGKPEQARNWLVTELGALSIDLRRVERVVGRAAGKWLAPDMAKLLAQVQSLKDGMADSEDLFPSEVTLADNAEADERAARGPVRDLGVREATPKAERKPRQAKEPGKDDLAPAPAEEIKAAEPQAEHKPDPEPELEAKLDEPHHADGLDTPLDDGEEADEEDNRPPVSHEGVGGLRFE